jgi:hypothetical protein
MLIPGGQIGEIVKDGVIQEKQYEAVNTDTLEYCWLHPYTLTSDWRNPNAEDKKKLDKIRLKEGKIYKEDGSVKKFRYCPKCQQVVWYTKEP